jgi:16S rRNA G966 N2-methylase RsmD
MDQKNKLYFGDNLKILRDYVEDASVDLIYLDPPFNSNATYNVLSKKGVAQGPLSGPAAFRVFPAAQTMAFEGKRVAPCGIARFMRPG